MPNLTPIDWLILLLYFAVALGIGFALKSSIKTSRDFFQAGRSLPTWICALAFIGASVGAPEIIGMGAAGAQYGLQAAQFFGIGAIPAMLFAGLFMMPLYYGSKAHSVPEFLRLRFDNKTRTLNACLFAPMTLCSAGISLYAMARVLQALHVFDTLFRTIGQPPQAIFACALLISAFLVMAYIVLGGLAAALYNQVLQFLIIVAAFLPLVLLGLKNVGGWAGLKASLPATLLHEWTGVFHAGANPMGLNVAALGIGLGLVLGAGYWCTDQRVLQAAMAAKDVDSARRAPVIAALPKMLLPFLIVLPGLLAVALPTPHTSTVTREDAGVIYRNTTVVPLEAELGKGLIPAKMIAATGKPVLTAAGQTQLNYGMATPTVLIHFLPTGMLGLGLAALLASLMAGVAANVAAFNTVFTCDLYRPYIRRDAGDSHYLTVGRYATVAAVLLSVAAAYAVLRVDNILDALLLLFSLVNAPLLAALLLGMFWKRTTGHGAFAGLLAGTATAALHHGLTLPLDATRGIQRLARPAPSLSQQPGAKSLRSHLRLHRRLASRRSGEPRDRAPPSSELAGLVHSLTPKSKSAPLPWWKRPEGLAVVILAVAVILNIVLA